MDDRELQTFLACQEFNMFAGGLTIGGPRPCPRCTPLSSVGGFPEKADVVLVDGVLGGRTRAPPDPPFTWGGCAPQ